MPASIDGAPWHKNPKVLLGLLAGAAMVITALLLMHFEIINGQSVCAALVGMTSSFVIVKALGGAEEPEPRGRPGGAFSDTEDEADETPKSCPTVVVLCNSMLPNGNDYQRFSPTLPGWVTMLQRMAGYDTIIALVDYRVPRPGEPGTITADVLVHVTADGSRHKAQALVNHLMATLSDKMPWMKHGVFCNMTSLKTAGAFSPTLKYAKDNTAASLAQTPNSVGTINGVPIRGMYHEGDCAGQEIEYTYVKFPCSKGYDEGCPAFRKLSLNISNALLTAGAVH
tara:strand:+ start:732 stop:1580 length:849 start_codon:yes stop_codon:yes gene_type:complete